jgi:ABC-2 type transport system ATP-binding protein
VAGIHRLGRKSKTRIAEMIEITGLTLEQNKKITQLSKGYRQRIGLAGALMHDPEVLILDEPTSGLDPNQLEDIRLLIQKIGKQKTVMLSTHIMQEVEAVCNRVIIIDQGKIVADDSVEKLGIIGHDTIVVKVEFDQDVDTKRLMKIPGITGVKSDPGHIYHLVSKTGNDIRPEIFRFAVDNKISVLSMNIEQQRLEKIFQMLTKK